MKEGDVVNGWELTYGSPGSRMWREVKETMPGVVSLLTVAASHPWFDGPPRVEMAGPFIGPAIMPPSHTCWFDQPEPNSLILRCICGAQDPNWTRGGISGVSNRISKAAAYSGSTDDLTPPQGNRLEYKTLEEPCPSCRTPLRSDEANCWRCGWKR